MHTLNLLENVEFHEPDPYAQPLLVNQDGRIIRFALKPGQSIREHNVPNSPFYVVVLKGTGRFRSGGGAEETVGPSTMLVFDPGEDHSVEAQDEELVFIGFLQGVPGTRPTHQGGEIGRA